MFILSENFRYISVVNQTHIKYKNVKKKKTKQQKSNVRMVFFLAILFNTKIFCFYDNRNTEMHWFPSQRWVFHQRAKHAQNKIQSF